MPDFFFSKAQIKPVLYLCASGKKKRRAKCCVCSTRASPLLPHLCLNAEGSLCCQKGSAKVFRTEQTTAVGRKGTGRQNASLWRPEGTKPRGNRGPLAVLCLVWGAEGCKPLVQHPRGTGMLAAGSSTWIRWWQLCRQHQDRC